MEKGQLKIRDEHPGAVRGRRCEAESHQADTKTPSGHCQDMMSHVPVMSPELPLLLSEVFGDVGVELSSGQPLVGDP